MVHSKYSGELILFSALAGAVIAPIKLLVHHIFVWTGLAQPFYTGLNAYLIHGHQKTKGPAEAIFGELGDMALGAFFGILLGLWLSRSRKHFHWLIGLGFGFGIWYGSLIFGNLTRILKDTQTTPWSLFAHLLAMLLFGLLFVLGSRIWRPLKERIEGNEGK